MSNYDQLKSQINAPDFFECLSKCDHDSWSILLQYIQCRISGMRIFLPRDLDRKGTIDEYVGAAVPAILASLDRYENRGLLSAYIDPIIKTSMANKNLKGLLEAITRFLSCVTYLTHEAQRKVEEVIGLLPEPQRSLLQTGIHTRHIHQDNRQSSYEWYNARYSLYRRQDFIHMLRELARKGCSQAETVIVWGQRFQGPESLDATFGEEQEDSETYQAEQLADTSPLPLENIIHHETTADLLQCLELLRQHSPKKYQIIYHRFYDTWSYQQLAALFVMKQQALRQVVSRALQELRDCMTTKHGEL